MSSHSSPASGHASGFFRRTIGAFGHLCAKSELLLKPVSDIFVFAMLQVKGNTTRSVHLCYMKSSIYLSMTISASVELSAKRGQLNEPGFVMRLINLNSAIVGDSHPRIRSSAIENSKVYFRYVGEHGISKINIYRIGHSQIFPNSAELR